MASFGNSVHQAVGVESVRVDRLGPPQVHGGVPGRWAKYTKLRSCTDNTTFCHFLFKLKILQINLRKFIKTN
jgi:hypothetical protein